MRGGEAANLPLAPPLKLGRAGFKSLGSAGHLVDRFLEAVAWEWTQLETTLKWRELSPLVAASPLEAGASSVALPDGGVFALALGLERKGWRLQPLILPESWAVAVLDVWHRVQPDAPRRDPALLAVPPLTQAPLWPALLHLQPLQSSWEQPLRRSHLHLLEGLLPGAWLMDPLPLPPGSVIPSLELASWKELPRLAARGKQFVIADAWGQETPVRLEAGAAWEDQVAAALQYDAAERRVLLELARPIAGWVFALYHKSGGRTSCMGAVALRPGEDDGWRASRVTA